MPNRRQNTQSSGTTEAQRLAVVGQMTTQMLHDVKNALCVIRGAAELAKHGGQSERAIDLIIRQSDDLVEMLQDVMWFARGAQQLALEPVRIDEFLTELIAAHRHLVDQAGVEVELQAEAGTVEIDATQLHRALLNLIVNAVEAMPQGGRLFIHAGFEGCYLVIECQDTGVGMEREVLDRLFEPFFTFGKSRGTGIGAAIAKSVIDAHGGHVHVRSAPGLGTTFTVYLPVAESSCPFAGAAGTQQLGGIVPSLDGSPQLVAI